MEETPIEKELAAIEVDDLEGLRQLADQIKSRAAGEPEQVVRFWRSGDDAQQYKAVQLIPMLEALMIEPLLRACESAESTARPDPLAWVVDIQLALRKKIVAHLDPLLEDKTLLPEPLRAMPSEEEPSVQRVCDEAYMLALKLLNVSKDEESVDMVAMEFLDMPFEERDEEIKTFRASEAWDRWLNQVD